MSDIAKSFVGLPLGLLICQPIMEVAKGQAALCQVYLDYLFKIGFEEASGDEPRKTKVIKFTLNRTYTSGAATSVVPVEIEAPLLSLIPVPAFTMEETTVKFTMEIKDQVIDKSSVDTTSTVTAGFSAWGFNANISGSVATKSEHTRTTDKSAKYEIFARAIQQPPAEGMAKLTALLSSVVEPVELKS